MGSRAYQGDLNAFGLAAVLVALGIPAAIAHSLGFMVSVLIVKTWMWKADRGYGIYFHVSIRPSLWIGGQ